MCSALIRQSFQVCNSAAYHLKPVKQNKASKHDVMAITGKGQLRARAQHHVRQIIPLNMRRMPDVQRVKIHDGFDRFYGDVRNCRSELDAVRRPHVFIGSFASQNSWARKISDKGGALSIELATWPRSTKICSSRIKATDSPALADMIGCEVPKDSIQGGASRAVAW